MNTALGCWLLGLWTGAVVGAITALYRRHQRVRAHNATLRCAIKAFAIREVIAEPRMVIADNGQAYLEEA